MGDLSLDDRIIQRWILMKQGMKPLPHNNITAWT
jgi:hypothetical protein